MAVSPIFQYEWCVAARGSTVSLVSNGAVLTVSSIALGSSSLSEDEAGVIVIMLNALTSNSMASVTESILIGVLFNLSSLLIFSECKMVRIEYELYGIDFYM